MSTVVEEVDVTESVDATESVGVVFSDMSDSEPDPGAAQGNLRTHLRRGAVRLLGLATVDLALILLARFVLRQARQGLFGTGIAETTDLLVPFGSISGAQLVVAIVIANLFFGCYRADDRWRDPVRVLSAAGVGTVLALYSDVWHGEALVVIGRGLLTWVLLGPLLVTGRVLAYRFAHSVARNGMRHRVLEITGSEPDHGVPELGRSYERVAAMHHSELPKDIDAMEPWLAGGVDTVLIRGHVPAARFADLTDFALTHSCRLLCLPRDQLLGIESKRVWLNGHPFSELTSPGLRASHLVLKRTLDIVGSAFLIALLSPLFLAVAVWVRLDSAGPVLFRQRRPGLRGKWFWMLKLRSMRPDAEEVLRSDPELYDEFIMNDCKLPEDRDPRLTPSGRFIRKSSLDELPQLFNVFRGDMSLVGPRPLVGPELENYLGRIPTLLSVKPGITGPWQVSGRSRVSYPERAEIDLEYVRNWSFLGDLWILVLTPIAVLLRRGAH